MLISAIGDYQPTPLDIVNCAPLVAPDETGIDVSMCANVSPGHTCTVGCSQGYQNDGQDEIFICPSDNTDSHNGQPTGVMPTCSSTAPPCVGTWSDCDSSCQREWTSAFSGQDCHIPTLPSEMACSPGKHDCPTGRILDSNAYFEVGGTVPGAA